MFNLQTLCNQVSLKHVLIVACCVSVVVFLYYAFVLEAFNNEVCGITAIGSQTARNTMKLLDETVGESNREQVNLDINYRDMQTMDMILNEDSKAWCSSLNEEELDKTLQDADKTMSQNGNINDNSYLYGNTDIMDANFMDSNFVDAPEEYTE